MVETGVIHGRFQVLHKDHLKYLLAGKKQCSHLVVGITNPDPTMTKDDSADPQRSKPIANPLTYFERYTLIQTALLEAGISFGEFSIVPLPINFPELYRHYVPFDATFFLTIYDSWGRRKLEFFKSLGLETKVLWEKPIEEKGISATHVRNQMAAGKEWEHLVPHSVAILMKEWHIPDRLRMLFTLLDSSQ
jgi:nicotinamide-nucleotide adenylyltransferase